MCVRRKYDISQGQKAIRYIKEYNLSLCDYTYYVLHIVCSLRCIRFIRFLNKSKNVLFFNKKKTPIHLV